MRWVGVPWVVVAVLAGCSDGAPGVAAPDAGSDAARWAPEPPRIPWLAAGVPPIAPPMLTPCPPGWREVHDRDVTTCDPYAESGPEVCAEGSAHFPGGRGCEPVGNPCPTGEWSDGLPATGVIYVRAGAPAGGDGTRAAPFARIADAMTAASTGDIVALTRGRFDETVTLPAGVTLQGACAADTVLTSSEASSTAGTVNVAAAATALRDVRIATSERPGLWVAGMGTELRAEGVIVSGARRVAIFVTGGARLVAREVAVRDTRAEPDGTRGRGIQAEYGAQVEMSLAVVDRNRGVGVIAFNPGTVLQLEDVVVRDNLGQESDRTGGTGLEVQSSARVEATRALFERNRTAAVLAGGAGTSVLLHDVVARDTWSRESDRNGGRGLDVGTGATAEVTRATLIGNRDVAVLAANPGTSVRLDDVVVRDTQSRELDATSGRGLEVQSGAAVDLARGVLGSNREIAIFATGSGTALRAQDLVVHDTQPQERDGTLGRGLDVTAGASAELARVLVERNRQVAVFVDGPGSSAVIVDAVVRETASRGTDGAFGRGLDVQRHASAQVTRALLDHNREVGVFAFSAGTSLRMEDVVVRDTLPAECGDRCPQGAGGMGLGSYSGAMMSLTRFVLARAELCGAHIALGGELDLSNGEVRESAFGGCVQVPGYRLSRLNASVIYVENGANLEATDFPVPEVSGPAGGL